MHLPVPRGFAITAYACTRFMEAGKLYEESRRILKGLDVEDTEKLVECSREIRSRIMDAPVPSDLEGCLLFECDALIKEFGPGIRFAVRSSATSEDSEASFAGQHSSVLGVGRDNLPQAYKEVVASTFNPRAIYYRRSRGYPDEYVIMSALCVAMVDARSSGVMYTRDPNDHRRDVFMINSVWGLGVNAVDGSSATDFYEVNREDKRILSTRIAHKEDRLVLGKDGSIAETEVPPDLRDRPCLTEDQILSLVEYGLTLEEHYRVPLDIEWAVDRQDKLILLQTRPLNLDMMSSRGESGTVDQDMEALARKFPDNPVLLHGGITASRGKACGFAYNLTSEHNLLNIPEGSILVAPQTSPPLCRHTRQSPGHRHRRRQRHRAHGLRRQGIRRSHSCRHRHGHPDHPPRGGNHRRRNQLCRVQGTGGKHSGAQKGRQSDEGQSDLQDGPRRR